MMTIVLNAAYLGSKKEAHEYLKEMFVFPDYYGNNLDALADVLSEMPRVRVLICNREGAGEYLWKLVRVFGDHADLVLL